MEPDLVVTVVGATGRQGGAVTRHLLAGGWRVRALTRRPDSRQARRLADSGAEVVRADMADVATLRAAFADAYGVFSVQNPMTGGGVETEVRHGKNVADAGPPRPFPMPTWLFERFVGTDLTTMWRWLRSGTVDVKPSETRTILPAALTVREWLTRRRAV